MNYRINSSDPFSPPNEYDGLNRRIVRDESGGSGELKHFYYNRQWQVIVEADPNDQPLVMYSYHPHYVDAVAVRIREDDAHIYLHDANFNVTAVMDDGGAVVERYAYTPYGNVTILDPNFGVDPNGSDIGNEYLYTGRRRDPETGLQLNRNRYYHQQLGRWVNRDPIGYLGGINLYGYVGGMPTKYTDNLGLQYPGYPMPPGIDLPETNQVTKKYCEAAKKNPKNGWLKCACEVSKDIGNAMSFMDWKGPKYKWFKCTRECIQERWEDAMDNQENGNPLDEDSAWDDWCNDCDTNNGSQSCCEKQVEAEQTELENCMKRKCGRWKWGNTFPINWIPNWPEDADFNNLDDRIDFGKKRCCPAQ